MIIVEAFVFSGIAAIGAAVAAAGITGVAAAVGATAAVGGLVVTELGRRDAQSARESASALRNEEARVARLRSERQIVRQSQLANSRLQVTAAGSNTQFSSNFFGDLSDLNGVTSFELNNLDQNFKRGLELQNAFNRQSKAQGVQGLGEGLTSFGSTLFLNSSKIGAIGQELKAGNFRGLLV